MDGFVGEYDYALSRRSSQAQFYGVIGRAYFPGEERLPDSLRSKPSKGAEFEACDPGTFG